MSTITIKGVETAEERACVYDLFAKVHYPGYFSGRASLDTLLANYPEYMPEHTRILLEDGELAAGLSLVTHTLRLGEARLKMGGFANVATAGPWRNKGYAARLMGDTMRFMERRNYHVSMLFGIADFYHRWGFATVLPEYGSVIDVREANTAAAEPWKRRAIKPGDIGAMLRIHHQNDADVACSLIRASGHVSNRWERWKNAQVITNPQGKVCAYYLGEARKGEFQVDEVGVVDHCWSAAVLQACVAVAKSEFASRIRFAAPPSHPFVQHLLRYRSDHEMRIFRDSDGMMAVVNIEETLESMTPEWESLLARAAATELCAECTLVINRRSYRVRAHRGAIDIAACAGPNKLGLSPTEFIQLLVGYRHLDEVLALKRRALSAPALALLNILFPKRSPYVWMCDRF